VPGQARVLVLVLAREPQRSLPIDAGQIKLRPAERMRETALPSTVSRTRSGEALLLGFPNGSAPVHGSIIRK
jgi:hypothetical protein